jgi:hypothetical protein
VGDPADSRFQEADSGSLANQIPRNRKLPMHKTHNRGPFQVPLRHKRAAKQVQKTASLLGNTVMLLTFIISWLRAKPAYVWRPALTLTDSRIVSELTGAAN